MISTAIQQLVNYGLDTGLILPDDAIYIRNQLLMTMQLDSFTEPEGEVFYKDLESILKTLVDDAVSRGVCADNSTARDLFDTKLMGVLTPRPSIVRANFEERYEEEGPQAATDWFYKFSQDTDYIRRYRIKRDLKWVTKTEYGDLDITINLSKPEKDPKAIAAAKLAPQSAYPKCQLCVVTENVTSNDCPAFKLMESLAVFISSEPAAAVVVAANTSGGFTPAPTMTIHASMIPAINFFAFFIRIPPLVCVLILCNSFYVLSYHSL